jgi:hypothetical protein
VSAEATIVVLARRKAAAEKTDFRVAVVEVARAHPHLAEAFRNAARGGR